MAAFAAAVRVTSQPDHSMAQHGTAHQITGSLAQQQRTSAPAPSAVNSWGTKKTMALRPVLRKHESAPESVNEGGE